MVLSFTSTCKLPYDRHDYDLVMKTGERYRFKDYEQARKVWFDVYETTCLSHIEVIDLEKLGDQEG